MYFILFTYLTIFDMSDKELKEKLKQARKENESKIESKKEKD
jgi:phosphoribosylcarboxyaminoimidazole (NCAIR) mutase